MSNTHKVYLTTPQGEVAIVKSKITAILATDIKVQGSDKVVRSQVFVDADRDPYNILEDFEYVTNKI